MSIKIEIHIILREFTDGRKVAEVKGETVGDCLRDLVRQFPALEGKLLDKQGKLANSLAVFLNRESPYPEELRKKVSDGDIISILMMIDGG